MRYSEKVLDLKKNCNQCSAFCCIALYFSKMDGFPYDKVAGESCRFLNLKNRCKIYKNLKTLGHKGCKHTIVLVEGLMLLKKLFRKKVGKW